VASQTAERQRCSALRRDYSGTGVCEARARALRLGQRLAASGVRDPEPKPDDAVLFDLLLAWAPDENVRHRILVENPAVLYGFPKNA
jgi:hypothetical protein